MSRPQAAIIGSGPSGIYAAEALLKAGVGVNIIERLPTPFGLVRSGVAPDHPKIKSVTALYEKILSHPELAFFGNVTVGRDVTVPELRDLYDAVILACGATTDARLNIPGEDLPGSYAAGAFVGWYNGHPDYRDLKFVLDADTAVVVGHGNVAIDLARILLAPLDRLSATDIAAHALEALAGSKIRHVHLVGRRGPVQASFTPAELKETVTLPGCSVHVEGGLELEAECQEELERPEREAARRNLVLLREATTSAAKPAARSLHFHFRASPLTACGHAAVTGLRLVRNRLIGSLGQRTAEPTGVIYEIPCGLLLRSVGFKGSPLVDVPFDAARGVVPNSEGRVLDGSEVLVGLYVTGWLKRGANGVIGTNRACGQETARVVIAHLETAKPSSAGRAGFIRLLQSRDIVPSSLEGWRNIDQAEQRIGKSRGKPREKFTTIMELLDASGRR